MPGLLIVAALALLAYTGKARATPGGETLASIGPGGQGCGVIWQDSFAAPEMEAQHGRGMRAELVIEWCPAAWDARAKVVKVWRRYVQEYVDGKRMEEREVIKWTLQNQQTVVP